MACITPEIPPTIAPSAKDESQAFNSVQPPENVKVVTITDTAPATKARTNLNIIDLIISLILLVLMRKAR